MDAVQVGPKASCELSMLTQNSMVPYGMVRNMNGVKY
jgi:hypothetical protein